MRILKKSTGGIKNVRKVIDYGITFDSRLEHMTYKTFSSSNIEFDFKPKYILQEKFDYMGEKVREMTLTPDFRLKSYPYIVDPKGFATTDAKLKFKLLKKHLKDNGENYHIVFLKNQQQVRDFVSAITSGKDYKQPKK